MRSNDRYKFLYYAAIVLLIASTIVVTMPGIDTEKAELYFKIRIDALSHFEY